MAATLTPTQTFRALVAEVAARAKEKLPDAVNGRIERAVKLVLAHDVTPQEDGTILVGSASDPLKTYRLVGQTCECKDFTDGKAPDGWCQHRISAGIAKRVQELLPAPVPPQRREPIPLEARFGPPANDADWPPDEEMLPDAPSTRIDPRFLTHIQGKPFVRFEGLLDMAHARGLVELSTTVVTVSTELAVCQAVARFADGLIVTDIGDATPQNVKKHMAPAFIRMAATRASARALRRALNIDLCAEEELGD